MDERKCWPQNSIQYKNEDISEWALGPAKTDLQNRIASLKCLEGQSSSGLSLVVICCARLLKFTSYGPNFQYVCNLVYGAFWIFVPWVPSIEFGSFPITG